MRLIHYSNQPLKSVYSVVQSSNPSFKPNGLWVSVEGDDDWKSWCEGEEFNLERLTHATEVVLKKDDNLIRISNGSELRSFDQQYRSKCHTEFSYDNIIYWDQVAKDYQGIIISPYLWSCRHDPVVCWYYSWDCACGCIWDTSAIAMVNLIEAVDA